MLSDFRFSARLRELRITKGWSQVQLADLADLTGSTVSRIERGEADVMWRTVIALCNALGCDPNAFTLEPKSYGKQRVGRPSAKS